MGGAACPLHDPGNDRSIERGSDLQAARRGSLTTPAKPAGERESDAALTPRSGTRSLSLCAIAIPSDLGAAPNGWHFRRAEVFRLQMKLILLRRCSPHLAVLAEASTCCP